MPDILMFTTGRTWRRAQAAVATVLGIVVVLWIVFGQTLTFGRQLIHVNLAIVLGTLTLVFCGAFAGGFFGRKP